MYNWYKKEKPILSLLGFGGGGTGTALGRGAPPLALGFGGYPYAGFITKDGLTNGYIQTYVTGNQPTYGGGTNLTGVAYSSGVNGRYSLPNPFGNLVDAAYRNTSFTIVEKLYQTGQAIGNAVIGGYMNSNTNPANVSTNLYYARYDDRNNGTCGGTWGTNYPHTLGSAYGSTSSSHPICSQLWDGWRASLFSWDASTNTLYWAGSDSNGSNILSFSGPSLANFQSGVGTGNLIYRTHGQTAGNSNFSWYLADYYIIYGLATTNITDARKYSMLSRTRHIDPDVESIGSPGTLSATYSTNNDGYSGAYIGDRTCGGVTYTTFEARPPNQTQVNTIISSWMNCKSYAEDGINPDVTGFGRFWGRTGNSLNLTFTGFQPNQEMGIFVYTAGARPITFSGLYSGTVTTVQYDYIYFNVNGSGGGTLTCSFGASGDPPYIYWCGPRYDDPGYF